MAEYLLKGKNCCLWNWFFMESVVFLLFSSEIISTLGGKIQEPCTQKNYLGFLLTDPTKEKPQHLHSFLQKLVFR
jgi:hypothetical protein